METKANTDMSRKQIDSVDGISKSPLKAPVAVTFGGFAYLSGIMAADYSSGLDARARAKPGLPFHQHPVTLQAEVIYENLVSTLRAVGASLDDVMVIHQFFTDKKYFEPYREVGRRYWGTDRPPSTALPCNELTVPQAFLEVDVTAALPGLGNSPQRISTDASPEMLGSYSQGLKAGDWVILAGATPADHTRTSAPYPGGLGIAVAPQARVDPNLWYGSQIDRQVEYIMFEKQRPVLEAAGSSLSRIVKADVYLSEMAEDYAGFQRAWEKVFGGHPPATTIVPIDGFGSTGSRVEIGIMALTNDSDLVVEHLVLSDIPAPLGHHPHATIAGDLLFLSTVLAADQGGLSAQARPSAGFPFARHQAAMEMEACLEIAAKICDRAGTSMDSMLKRRNYYTDISDIAVTEAVANSIWTDSAPASANIGVRGPISVPDCRVVMDMVCAIP